MMRPVFSNMLGSLGLHLAFLVFPAADKQGVRTVEPTKDGTFVVRVGPQEFRYRLPLGSLLPPAIDQRTGETFPGNYHFNPYTGNKLVPAPTNSPANSLSAPQPPAPAAKPSPVDQPAAPPAQQPGTPGSGGRGSRDG